MKRRHWLYTFRGRQFLIEEYVKKKKSADQIAEELGSYQRLVHRAIVRHKIPTRDKSAANLAAQNHGRRGRGEARPPWLLMNYQQVVPSDVPFDKTVSAGCCVIPDFEEIEP